MSYNMEWESYRICWQREGLYRVGVNLPQVVDTVASGQGTNTVTLTNNNTYTLNSLAGCTIMFSGTPNTYYTINSNAAKVAQPLVLVLSTTSPASCNGNTVYWVDSPNMASSTFYAMPIRVSERPEYGRVWEKSAGWIPGVGGDVGYAVQKSYKQPPLTISGPVYNFNLLYLMMGGCHTTGANPYTHTYATNYSPSRPANPPSFQIWEQFIDDNGNTIKLFLHTGCIITKCVFSGSIGSDEIIATLTIAYSNTVNAVMLTSIPSMVSSVHPHHIDNCTFQISHNGTYLWDSTHSVFMPTGFTVTIDQGAYPCRVGGEIVPTRAFYGNRDITIALEGLPKDWTDFADDELDPASQDWTFDLKMSRNDTNDYDEFTFTHFWSVDYEYGTFRFHSRLLQRQKKYGPNPSKSPVFTIVQVDTNADASGLMFGGG